nr:enoyl-CoA-hydratase DpgB [Planosporangium mesophilum]
MSRLTDFYLELNGAAVLSAELVESVDAVCRQVGDGKKDASLLVRIVGAADGGGSVGAADGGGSVGAADGGGHVGAADGAGHLGGTSDQPWPYDVSVHTVNQWERALRRLERLPALTVTVVDGACRGPALDVLLTTDYRIASRYARLGVSSVGRNTWPGMALHRLANQVGVARARSAALFGTEIDAARAREWGLLDEVVDDAASRCREVLNTFAGLSGKELSIRRQLLFEASSTSFEDALGAHLAACDRALRLASTGPDAASGMPGAAG